MGAALAVNFSLPLVEYLREGGRGCDLFKFSPDLPSLGAEVADLLPVYYHFPLAAGRYNPLWFDPQKIDYWRSLSVIPHINLHIAPRAAEFAGLPEGERSEIILEKVKSDVRRLSAHYPPALLVLENTYADTEEDIPLEAVRPDFICRAVRETGCGFLLDLAHARSAAGQLGLDADAYIEALPLEQLREIHISGTRYMAEKGYRKDHFPLDDGDWELTEWFFSCISGGRCPPPLLVALEHGGVARPGSSPGPFVERMDPACLKFEIPRLSRLVASMRPARPEEVFPAAPE